VIQRVKEATGHKSLGPLQSRVNAPVRLT